MNHADDIVSSALRSIAPRRAFSEELLRMLRDAPVFALEIPDRRAEKARLLMVTGWVAGVVGVAGAAYTVARRSRRRGAE